MNMPYRFLAILLAIALSLSILTSCAERGNASEALAEPEAASPPESETNPPPTGPASESDRHAAEANGDGLQEYAIAFAETFHTAFDSAEELDQENAIGWFSFWRIYDEDPLEPDAAGVCFIPKDRLSEFVSLHFGIERYTYQASPENSPDAYPRYDESLGGYLFLPVSEGPLVEVEILEEIQDGSGLLYRMKLSKKDLATGAIVSDSIMGYQFEVVELDGVKLLKAISCAVESSEDLRPATVSIPVISALDEASDKTINFSLFIPAEWAESDAGAGIEFHDEDGALAANITCRDLTFEDTDSMYSDAVNARDFTVRDYRGKSYHMQTEVTDGGISAFHNELMYCLDTGGGMLIFAFYPYFGTGVGTQSERFLSYIDTVEMF